jgi:hypothetical protein
MKTRERLNLLRATLLFTLILTALALFRFTRSIGDAGLLKLPKWQVVIGLGIAGVILEVTLSIAAWTGLGERILDWLDRILVQFCRLKWVNLILFAAAISLFSFLFIGPVAVRLQDITMRLLLYWLVVLSGGFLLRASGFNKGWLELLAGSALLAAAGFEIATYLSSISAYPFTMSWSEASRYYYASLYFSNQLYGMSVPPTVLHPSRYLLQSAPFLIPNSPLWLHRLWQVILWIGLTWITAWLLTRRLSIPDRLRRWMLISWAFLFLLIGPVYYHLLVPVILLLWLFDRQSFWKSLIAVLLASVWAGISRINWFPVPAMLAAALYFLEEPVQKRPLWRYLVLPVIWAGLGTATAFGAQALYMNLSGNPPDQFSSSLTSDLLWYRLFPNSTYPIGILPAALLVSLPLFLLAFWRQSSRWRAYHFIRLLGLAAILLVLFAGGLVVSTKIGGGSNLHNMDAYMVLVLVICAYLYFDKFQADWEEKIASPADTHARRIFHIGALAFAVLLALYFTIPSGAPFTPPSPKFIEDALETIRSYVHDTAQQGGEVLFISERQLLTFNEVDPVKLVPDYEKVFLMEMAMSGNPDYLNRFHAELKNHRFGLIISEPLYVRRKSSDEIFGEENNAWVQQVSKPVLCYYKPKKSLLIDVPIQILVPRTVPDPACQE